MDELQRERARSVEDGAQPVKESPHRVGADTVRAVDHSQQLQASSRNKRMVVAEAKEAVRLNDAPSMRRFELPDLTNHGGWITKRLLTAFPHRTAQDLAGWLRGILYSNEFLFLYQDHGVALATVTRAHPLEPRPIVQEMFVLVEEGHVQEGAVFYDWFVRWAKAQSIDTIAVEALSDVPHDMIKERVGRLFTKQVIFARL